MSAVAAGHPHHGPDDEQQNVHNHPENDDERHTDAGSDVAGILTGLQRLPDLTGAGLRGGASRRGSPHDNPNQEQRIDGQEEPPENALALSRGRLLGGRRRIRR